MLMSDVGAAGEFGFFYPAEQPLLEPARFLFFHTQKQIKGLRGLNFDFDWFPILNKRTINSSRAGYSALIALREYGSKAAGGQVDGKKGLKKIKVDICHTDALRSQI